ncbi:hypothetical protein PLICRDRAFT_39121 [Plicaturopsis crispa FD-325 SS-3]|nr:hypothetical protein PLICRDRAFT_39121 [Plicaturopsis crispa FD-325 SS-3]
MFAAIRTPTSTSHLHRKLPKPPLSKRLSSSTSTARPLRRSYLYVPCSSKRMLEKSLSSPSDVIIYDLEDSVAPADKAMARTQLAEFLTSGRCDLSPERIAVRVNDASTPLHDADLQSILAIPSVRTVVLPKVDTPDALDRVSAHARWATHFVASIESARGLWNIGSIASWKPERGEGHVSALLFAAEDYCAQTGILRSAERTELLYPRSQIVTAAKAFGLDAIDMVCVNYKDLAYLEDECKDGRRLGFTGKQAIHPTQVDVIQSTFVPTPKEILRAAKIVHQMEKAYATQKGAFGLDIEGGQGGREMIDAPMLKQAQQTIAIARRAGLVIPEVS